MKATCGGRQVEVPLCHFYSTKIPKNHSTLDRRSLDQYKMDENVVLIRGYIKVKLKKEKTMKKIMLMGLLLLPMEAFSSKNIQIDIMNFAFQPNEIQAEVGDVLIFVNKDTAPHSVVPASDSPLKFTKSGTLVTDQNFELKIEEAKDIKVKCGLHPRMPGVNIVVTAPAECNECECKCEDEDEGEGEGEE